MQKRVRDYNFATDQGQEVVVDRRSNRYGKSLLEDVSIRRPAVSNEEWPEILDADGNVIDSGGDTDTCEYIFKAKVSRERITRQNREIDENVYEREDYYFVHFRMDMDFLTVTDEILWHKHIDSQNGSVPDIVDLQDTDKGILTILSIEEHRGVQRIYCQFYDVA